MRRRRSQPHRESLGRLQDEGAATRSAAGAPDAADDLPSPCTGVCSLGPNDTCPACCRTLDEIAGWIGFTSDQKRAVLRAVVARRAAV